MGNKSAQRRLRKYAYPRPTHLDTFSGPIFGLKTCRLGGDLQSNAAEFLCNSDCMAERLGLEPSLPFVSGH